MDTTALAERLEEMRDSLATFTDGMKAAARDGALADIAALTEAATRLRAVAGEPVGYADGSRFHELREGRMNLALWADRGVYADTPLYTRPQPATPATVTDEDVERAQMILLERGGYVVPKADMRAALESFANKEPTDE